MFILSRLWRIHRRFIYSCWIFSIIKTLFFFNRFILIIISYNLILLLFIITFFMNQILLIYVLNNTILFIIFYLFILTLFFLICINLNYNICFLISRCQSFKYFCFFRLWRLLLFFKRLIFFFLIIWLRKNFF